MLAGLLGGGRRKLERMIRYVPRMRPGPWGEGDAPVRSCWGGS